MLKSILSYAHHLLKDTVKPGEIAIDATCGNGHDTLMLAKLVGNQGKVLAFDVQTQAIENTATLLNQHDMSNVTLIHDGHENVSTYIKDYDEIGGAIFNLGYLPGSDKTIITNGASTVTAIQEILFKLKKNGLIIMVVYHGHKGGKEEKNQILGCVENLEQKYYEVLRYEFINQKNNPPFILALQKK